MCSPVMSMTADQGLGVDLKLVVGPTKQDIHIPWIEVP